MGASFTLRCCQCCLTSREEKKAILRLNRTLTSRRAEQLTSESSDSDNEEDSLFGPPSSKNSRRGQRRPSDPWAASDSLVDSCSSRGSEKELQAFLSMRDEADQATEEWEKLNYDIYTLRCTRREVRSRWKKILLQLGYECEVESLLDVNKQSSFRRDREHLKEAQELLKQLLDHSSLFPPGTQNRSRYLHVMDRLVSLDSAEDFIRLAKEKYPKKDG
ncbi:melanoregulin [Oryzias melastigma]|uniref:Melanoregulin-like n=1 Tax=Oryzias melastigma TaxID=30732 RepID=A0A3B3CBP4_ORYME|nr:melanoregulin [Oryzias melastigma]